MALKRFLMVVQMVGLVIKAVSAQQGTALVATIPQSSFPLKVDLPTTNMSLLAVAP